jgi:pyruvate ferredoxin oxidoreductase beta subunit
MGWDKGTLMKQNELILGQKIMNPGHNLCPGCAEGIALRIVTKALGESTIIVHSASCIGNPFMIYPSAIAVPSLYVSFASASAAISGVSAALRYLQKTGTSNKNINLAVFAGDGGTSDIGFASLSGAAERNEDVIYVCLDNEAYMMTGIQRSSQTPEWAWTTTTPLGKSESQKDMPMIMAAHKIPYVATASVAYPLDLADKIAKARNMGRGFKYIHVHAPCPTGWRFPEDKTIKMARLAVETGVWKLFEITRGSSKKLTYKPKNRQPVLTYFKSQGRFSSLSAKTLDSIQKNVDKECRRYGF